MKIKDLKFVVVDSNIDDYREFANPGDGSGCFSVLDRMTGYGYRDIETGYFDIDGYFWLLSGWFDVRIKCAEMTTFEAAEYIKSRSTCGYRSPYIQDNYDHDGRRTDRYTID